MSADAPTTHCCCCFKANPERLYPYREAVRMTIPLCEDCYKRLRIARLVRSVAILLTLTGVAVAGGIYVSQTGLSGAEVVLVPAVIGVAMVLAFAVILMLPRWMHVDILRARRPSRRAAFAVVTFNNPEYQKLYEQYCQELAELMQADAEA